MTKSLEKKIEGWMYVAMFTGAIVGAVAGSLIKPYLDNFVSYVTEIRSSSLDNTYSR